jgi:hypothetical protein
LDLALGDEAVKPKPSKKGKPNTPNNFAEK